MNSNEILRALFPLIMLAVFVGGAVLAYLEYLDDLNRQRRERSRR